MLGKLTALSFVQRKERDMPDWNVILHLLTLTLVGLGGYLLVVFRTATEAAVKTSAEEGAKAAIRNLEWPKEFARELQKSRGLERQELRFKSYGTLWKELRPLAIYDVVRIDKQAAANLSSNLTNWYFSECGGLLLTPQAREFYFALQDLLRVISTIANPWNADRSEKLEGDANPIFHELLRANHASGAISVLNYFSNSSFEDWQQKAVSFGKEWRASIKQFGPVWSELTEHERFEVLQQVGSKLRSTLVNDLESRER
jgi:hypothetical protein